MQSQLVVLHILSKEYIDLYVCICILFIQFGYGTIAATVFYNDNKIIFYFSAAWIFLLLWKQWFDVASVLSISCPRIEA